MPKHETPPGGSKVDTLRTRLEGDSACRMKINLAAGGSRSSEDRGQAPLNCSSRKCKSPKGCGLRFEV